MKIEWQLVPAVGYVPLVTGKCSIVGRFGMRTVLQTDTGRKTTRVHMESAWNKTAQNPFGNQMPLLHEEITLDKSNIKMVIECENRANAPVGVDFMTCPRVQIRQDKTKPVVGALYLYIKEVVLSDQLGRSGLFNETYIPMFLRSGAKIDISLNPLVEVEETDGNLYESSFEKTTIDEFMKL